jgi:hypothetical protein
MLEEEAVARRGYWRRQQKREEELTKHEFALSQKLLHDIDNVTVTIVEEALQMMEERKHDLEEASKREVQRRSDAEEELSSVIPPDIFSILTFGDKDELEKEESHFSSHVKFVDTVRRFFSKLVVEEGNFNDRLNELADMGSSSDQENILRQRYRQAKMRLQADLQDQIMTRTENMDDAQAGVEYARQRNELLMTEAKGVLTGEVIVAGSYDCTLPGVYGDGDLTSASSNRELLPLLKQLIAMLESGGPFVLSSELIAALSGGNVSVSPTVAEDPMKAKGVSAPKSIVKEGSVKPRTRNLQSEVIQMNAADIRADTNVVKAPEPAKEMTEEERIKHQKLLFEKQAFEAAKLESDLMTEEVDSTNVIINETEGKKATCTEDVAKVLMAKLQDANNDTEREKILLEYATNLQKVTDGLEKQKRHSLESLRQKLLNRRRQAKKDLHKKHIEETKSTNLGADVVPEIQVANHDQMERDLLLLQQQQQKMIAELENGKTGDDGPSDEEMEARLRALHIGKSTLDAKSQIPIFSPSFVLATAVSALQLQGKLHLTKWVPVVTWEA